MIKKLIKKYKSIKDFVDINLYMIDYKNISDINYSHNGSNLCILVLGVSGNVSAGILKVVRANFKNAYIIGSCVNKTFNSIYSDEFIISPYASDDLFSEWIKDLCVSKNVNVILSGVEEVNDALSLLKEELLNLAQKPDSKHLQ